MKSIFLMLRLLPAIMLISAFNGIAQDNNPYEAMPVQDADGNTYKTIITEDGMWMAENLRTTTFNDGTPIETVKDINSWNDLKSPACGWYSEDTNYKKTYGAIYNWHAVATGKLCPVGWHVPNDDEWNSMMDYAGGIERSGDNPAKLKEAGTAHWKSPNEGATNAIFFTALPAGEVSYFYTNAEPGTMTHWWTSTEDKADPDSGNPTPANALIIGLSYNFHSKSAGTFEKEAALPVRCMMDR